MLDNVVFEYFSSVTESWKYILNVFLPFCAVRTSHARVCLPRCLLAINSRLSRCFVVANESSQPRILLTSATAPSQGHSAARAPTYTTPRSVREHAEILQPQSLRTQEAYHFQPAMSHIPTAAGSGQGDPTSASVKSSVSPSPATASAPKLRSCVICRSRKVRCDKLSPCSNCRRANIACQYPSTDRPPRWARRRERIANSAASGAKATQEAGPEVGQVMERLHTLESLVKELSGQLEQANATAHSNGDGSSGVNSPGSSPYDRDPDNQMDASSAGVQKKFGRMVIQDPNRSRYVSSGFWSRVNDEAS
jgi:Fungal Zn(2)-Cys(6) binuclear cluster domain